MARKVVLFAIVVVVVLAVTDFVFVNKLFGQKDSKGELEVNPNVADLDSAANVAVQSSEQSAPEQTTIEMPEKEDLFDELIDREENAYGEPGNWDNNYPGGIGGMIV